MATPTTLPATFTAGQVLTAAQMNDLRGAFRILQVVQTVYATATTSTSASYVTTGLNATITPSSTSSKILVLVAGTARNHASGSEGTWSLFRGTVAGTNLATTTSAGFLRVFPAVLVGLSIHFLDSPSTTSAQTYTLGMKAESGGQSVTWSQSDTTSTMILMEVSA